MTADSSTEKVLAAGRVVSYPIDPSMILPGDFVLYSSPAGTEMLQVDQVGPDSITSSRVQYSKTGGAQWEMVWRNPSHRRPAAGFRAGLGR